MMEHGRLRLVVKRVIPNNLSPSAYVSIHSTELKHAGRCQIQILDSRRPPQLLSLHQGTYSGTPQTFGQSLHVLIYCQNALELFAPLPPEKIQAIAFEIAVLDANGLRFHPVASGLLI